MHLKTYKESWKPQQRAVSECPSLQTSKSRHTINEQIKYIVYQKVVSALGKKNNKWTRERPIILCRLVGEILLQLKDLKKDPKEVKEETMGKNCRKSIQGGGTASVQFLKKVYVR